MTDHDPSSHTDASGAPLLPDCRQAKRSLVSLERQLRVPARDGRPPLDDDGPLDLTWLHAHLDACARCTERLGRRVRSVEARVSLRQRSAPERIFEDFYEGVRERARLVPPGGAMSAAFLDAPRALHVWRSTALAATVLFAVGLGILWTREPPPGVASGGGRSARPLADPRSELLPAFTSTPARSAGPRRAGSLMLRPMPPLRPRGHRGFYGTEPRVGAPAPEATVVPASAPPRATPRWD